MLLLASQSPRRAELLRQLAVQFRQQGADIDESPLPGEPVQQQVLRLAIAKAEALVPQLQEGEDWVLGSDTLVAYEQEALAKPRDLQDFLAMMRRLSGAWHQVHTAVALCSRDAVKSVLVSTQVQFKSLTEQEMRAYWQSGEPQDKAGGYGIQGLAGKFVIQIQGSYSAVVGLPLYETAELLQSVGVDV